MDDYIKLTSLDNLIRLPPVLRKTGLSRTTIWRLERKGLFPKHRKLSRRAIGWLESEVQKWIESR